MIGRNIARKVIRNLIHPIGLGWSLGTVAGDGTIPISYGDGTYEGGAITAVSTIRAGSTFSITCTNPVNGLAYIAIKFGATVICYATPVSVASNVISAVVPSAANFMHNEDYTLEVA